jgi:hypothetical protein
VSIPLYSAADQAHTRALSPSRFPFLETVSFLAHTSQPMVLNARGLVVPTQVTSLSLSNFKLSARVFSKLANKLNNLASLKLCTGHTTMACMDPMQIDLSALQGLPALRSLYLGALSGDAGLERLTQLDSLHVRMPNHVPELSRGEMEDCRYCHCHKQK